MNIPDSYWSAEPPTKPGWYLWRRSEADAELPVFVIRFSVTAFRNPFNLDIVECSKAGGLWCRLVPEAGTVPKEEVHRAFVEAQSIDYKNCAVPNYAGPTRFEKSRARKVMDGTL